MKEFNKVTLQLNYAELEVGVDKYRYLGTTGPGMKKKREEIGVF